jgi:hypothetical protein
MKAFGAVDGEAAVFFMVGWAVSGKEKLFTKIIFNSMHFGLMKI